MDCGDIYVQTTGFQKNLCLFLVIENLEALRKMWKLSNLHLFCPTIHYLMHNNCFDLIFMKGYSGKGKYFLLGLLASLHMRVVEVILK